VLEAEKDLEIVLASSTNHKQPIVRIISATNSDLQRLLASQKRFRPGFVYRLNTIQLRVLGLN